MIFLGADLSQAENRVVLMLTRHPAMIELARSKPWELDMHTANAATLFAVPPKAVTKDQRHLGKVMSHGIQRGMGAQTLSDHVLKELGIALGLDECQGFISAYMRRYAPLTDYFAHIKYLVLKYRVLVNTWGRMMRFDHEHLDDEAVLRQAFSFPPQSEVVDIVNQYGFLPLFDEMMRRYQRPPNNHCHDSLLASVPAADAWDMAQFVQRSLERPRIYYGEALTIPATLSVGSTWNMEYEFVKPPTRDEFEAAVADCERKAAA